MPELAEVEYFRKQWDAGIGHHILAVKVHAGKRIFRGTDSLALVRHLTGSKLLRSFARGKQMLFEFSGNNWLGLHLGMTGKMRVEQIGFRAEKHDHLILEQAQRALVFRDSRQFGRVRFHHGKREPEWWRLPGPEVIARDFNQQFLDDFLRRHGRAPIKAVLLLQSGFPGIGNWMADEILWRAKIRPSRRAGKLTAAQRNAVLQATRLISRESLRIIARELSDPPKSWLMHQRWTRNGSCPRDRTPLHYATIGGRTTAWCAKCQR